MNENDLPALEPGLFELSRPGREATRVPPADPDAHEVIPEHLRRRTPPALPQVDEPTVVRHFTRLSQLNYSIDTGFYPLGSCTMKYNPRINEQVARLDGFARLHPWAPDAVAQGTLRLMHELQALLGAVSGMAQVTLQPAAGAQGEFTALQIFRAAHAARGQGDRTEVVVSDSSHGTNPATVSMAGYRTVTVPSGAHGTVDPAALCEVVGRQTAAVMLTNPSTVGLFEERIEEILQVVHDAGALAYMDGANLNAVLGRFRPGDAGFDAMHFNLHKTFSTPHGGGGPGSGPVGVAEHLIPYLPGPLVLRDPDGSFRLERSGERPESVGRMRSFAGNTGVLVRAYAYIRAHGADGLRQISEDAVLAANYLQARLRDALHLPFDRHCQHEFVASAKDVKARTGLRTLDLAKRLIDLGYHPPTVYFPLIVEEALLIEPTETESLRTLDAFADALLQVLREADEEPELIRRAPTLAPVRRVDEARAARQPDLRWRPPVEERELEPVG